ncbi:hypothetical protein N7485_005809 [Penicillium canescens]|nr:hypothetical protein N7485_005809 [Penicillium canescens]
MIRPIDKEGNVHAEQQYEHQPSCVSWSEMEIHWAVTTLHWAAAGPVSFECWLPDEEIRNRIINTLKLLLAGRPDNDINARDNQGATPLHYAISNHFDAVVKFLLEIGGDAAVGGINNRTVLHQLAARYMDGEPIGRALIDILLSHDVKINRQDNNGNTALHLMTRNPRHDPGYSRC